MAKRNIVDIQPLELEYDYNNMFVTASKLGYSPYDIKNNFISENTLNNFRNNGNVEIFSVMSMMSCLGTDNINDVLSIYQPHNKKEIVIPDYRQYERKQVDRIMLTIDYTNLFDTLDELNISKRHFVDLCPISSKTLNYIKKPYNLQMNTIVSMMSSLGTDDINKVLRIYQPDKTIIV